MLGIVIEVSAMLVDMINFLQLAGARLNILCCCASGKEEYRQ